MNNNQAKTVAETRGIATAAQAMGIQSNGTVWQYLIHDNIRGGTRTRFKALDKQNAPQAYWWANDLEGQVKYWHHPSLKEAIIAAEGLLYIAAGEIDLLTFIETETYNVLTWFGEGSVPDTLAEDLQNLAVQRIIYAPDLDETGKKSALKVRDYLRDTNIFYEFKQLPPELGQGGDTNDLWQARQFDKAAFFAAIHHAPELELPLLEPKIVYSSSDFEQTPAGLIERIISELRHRGFKGRGDWLSGRSLFRDEKKASFSVNTQSGVATDFATGENYSPFALAEELGIDWKSYYPQRQIVPHIGVLTTKPARPKAEIRYLPEATFGTDGLPKQFLAAIMLANVGRGQTRLAKLASQTISLAAERQLPVYGAAWAFTADDLARVLDIPIQTLYGKNGELKKLIELGIIEELTPIDIAKFLAVNTPLSGTNLYQVVTSRLMISSHLLQAIACRLKEYSFPTTGSHALAAPFDDMMLAQLNIFDVSIVDMFDELLADNKDVQRRLRWIDTELQYWRDMLADSKQDHYFSADEMAHFTSDGDIRIALMKPCIGHDLYSGDVKRIIGTLSNGTLKNIRDAAQIKTVENLPVSDMLAINEDLREDREQFYALMNQAISNAGRDKQGRVVKSYLQIEGQAALVSVSVFQKYRYGDAETHNQTVEFYREKITGICFAVQTASSYVEMTEEEIKAVKRKKAEKKAQKQAQKTAEKTQVKQVEARDFPLYDYDPLWLYETTALWYAIFTGHEAPATMSEAEMIAAMLFSYHTMHCLTGAFAASINRNSP